jgi:CelD/BcsL family acetyltransferase involved in cellulose biosynthesis
MDIRVKKTAELTAVEWSAWDEIQGSSRVYESPYFRPHFAQAVAAVRSDAEVAVLSENGQVVGFFPFQRGPLNLGKPIGGKLSDYHGPLLAPGASVDPRALLAACKLASWDFDHFVSTTPALEPFIRERGKSPQMDLSEGFDAYARRRREAGSEVIQKQGQKTRKLSREVGPLRFELDARDDESYDLLRKWKSAQYIATGMGDVFSFPWTLELISKLRHHTGEDFAAPLTVLRAGEKIAALCLCLRSRDVLHGWFTAYNPELHNYSSGISLFIRLAEEAEQLGIRKFDMGRGDEPYKWRLASTSIEVGEGSVTTRSLATLLRAGWRQTRDWAAKSPLKGTAALSSRLLKPIREWVAYG